MYGYYWGNRKYIQQQVDNMSRQYNVDLVIYDETEHFQPYWHKDFDYPYAARKNLLNTFKLGFQLKQGNGT